MSTKDFITSYPSNASPSIDVVHDLIGLTVELLHHIANCEVPRPPGNGSIVNYTSAVEGSTLLYQCNPGFCPVSEMTAVCAANGSWSLDHADVTCREIGMLGNR